MQSDQSSNRKLRVGLAGAGMISLYHMRGWEVVEGADVVAVCDPVIDSAQMRASEFGIDAVFEDAATMMDACALDAIDIAASVGAHAPLVREAAARGIHVLVQKPLTETVREAEDLISDVGDSVRFMVHENYRFRPHYLKVREWIADGRIGQPKHAQMNVRGSGLVSLNGETPFLVKRQPYLTGFRRNLVFETMIHHLDVLRLLFGPLSVVAARLNRLNKNLPGEDTAAILLEGPDGFIATVDGCIAAPGYPDLHGDRLEVIGTTGTLVMDYNRVVLLGHEDEGYDVDLIGRYQECFTHAIAEFVSGIRDSRPFETDRLDNLETLRLMEACYIAAGVEV
ncbi:MAG: Gfo/Idh/MocA family oxidoreductase [Pseudomonadota bacterium]